MGLHFTVCSDHVGMRSVGSRTNLAPLLFGVISSHDRARHSSDPLAAIGFVATGSSHPTSLIPAAIGLLFIVFGALANSDNPKKRMLWMHIAVTVALLMFLGTIPADIDVVRLSHGAYFAHPIAVEEKAAMSLLCLIFVLLCVRSFIAARRQRLA